MIGRTLSLLVAAAALSLPLALAAAADGVPAWQAKLDAFEKTGAAERKRLGLDRPAAKESLHRSYPTPEVTFEPRSRVCPGGTADVKLGGKVQEGALVVARTADAEVVSGGRTKDGGWAGKIKVSPLAAPGQVPLVVVAPVSTVETHGWSLIVGCRYTFTLEVGDDTLQLSGDFDLDENHLLEGEWRRGGKPLGRRSYATQVSEGSLSLGQQQSPEEMQHQVGGFQTVMASKAWKDLDARTNVEMKKLEGCGKLPPAKMGPCFAGPQQVMEQLNTERQALIAKAELEGAPAFGCRNLRLSLRAGKVEGDAEQCAGKRTNDRVKLAGKYSAP